MRSDFDSSRLVNLLGEWSPSEAELSGIDFVERLSLWVNAFDAIGLQAAHQSIKAIRTPAPRKARDARAATPQSLEEALHQVRTVLAGTIAQDALQVGEGDAPYTPYRQRHLELQRRMEQMIGPLRGHVREVLSCASARLRQLAALDAVLEQMIAPREQLLMARTVFHLERRFGQLRLAGDGDWLHAFGCDWRRALLAELDLRLEPVTGLVEAMNNELKSR